jgi:hypothetical protein
MPRLMKAEARELAKYKLNLALVQEFIVDKAGTEWAVYFTIFFVNRKES